MKSLINFVLHARVVRARDFGNTNEGDRFANKLMRLYSIPTLKAMKEKGD